MTTIYVDADACPVRAETVRVAERHKVNVKMVCNGGIRPDPHPLVDTIVVPGGADEADIWIADEISESDICVTVDIVLASRCIEKGGLVLKHNGDGLSDKNIGNALAMRDLMADFRAANPLAAGGGGKGFTKQDKSKFLEALERELRALKV